MTNLDRPAGAVAVGETVGVEEEYHLVDPVTGELARRPPLAAAAAAGDLGPGIHGELQVSQLEVVTEICRGLDDVRAALTAGRRRASAAASATGAALFAAGTHPFATWADLQRAPRDRYDALAERFGALADRQGICGCHVHVGVPDFEQALEIMNHVRPYLAVLAALTASSPFSDGVDTRFASYRTMWWSTWPTSGPPPRLASLAEYDRVVGRLVDIGVMDDASTLYWDLRPSTKYPTLEFRVADTCTHLDDAVLHAALSRALVRTVAGRVEEGRPAPDVPDEALRAARWRAARFGLTGELVDPSSQTVLPAGLVLRRLVAELEPDLRAHEEYGAVCQLLDRLLRRGTSAERQRSRYAATRDLRVVVRDVVRETLVGVGGDAPAISGALALQPETPPPLPPSVAVAAPDGRSSGLRTRQRGRAAARRSQPLRGR